MSNEYGYYHIDRGYWQTTGKPSEEILAGYPDGTAEYPLKPGDNYHPSNGGWEYREPVITPEFKPIEPTPFWQAAYDLMTPPLKKSDVLDAIADPDERYLAELDINGRKTYLRDDPLVAQLSALKGFTAAEMDSLWLYVQEHYR